MMRKLALLFILLSAFDVVFAQSDADSSSNSVSVSNAKNDSITQTEDVITQPEFKGGIEKMYKYISDNFEYPEEAKRRSVNGKIEVEFTVEKSGDITYVGILKGLDYSIDDEVLRLLKAMPRWTPATKNGVPVRYRVSMPITIRASRKSQKSSIDLQDYRDQ
jgi:TonB family protein